MLQGKFSAVVGNPKRLFERQYLGGIRSGNLATGVASHGCWANIPRSQQVDKAELNNDANRLAKMDFSHARSNLASSRMSSSETSN